MIVVMIHTFFVGLNLVRTGLVINIPKIMMKVNESIPKIIETNVPYSYCSLFSFKSNKIDFTVYNTAVIMPVDQPIILFNNNVTPAKIVINGIKIRE